MRYIYFPSSPKSWFDLAVYLHDSHIATPALWIGDPIHEGKAISKFGADVVKSMDMFVHFPWRIMGVAYQGEHAAFFHSIEYYRTKDRALKMMDRLDIHGVFSRLDREVYFKNICIWALTVMPKLNADCLIMTEAPHSHAQYTLYEICQYLNIRTYKVQPWLIVPILTIKSMDNRAIVVQDKTEKQEEVHAKIRSVISNHVERIRNSIDSSKYEANSIKEQRKASSVLMQLSEFVSRKYYHTILSRYYHRFKFFLRKEYFPVLPAFPHIVLSGYQKWVKRRCVRYYYTKHSHTTPDMTQKYVYFGLHYEPERTSNPDGGDYHDQVLSLIKLRKFLPEDVHIYVKEHPSSFFKSVKKVLGRSPLFYEHIKNIKGVTLVGMNVASIDLVRHSIFVSTISGSLAHEAAIMGKKAIAFGDCWCEKMPNVTSWDDSLNYDQFINMPLHSHDAVKEFMLKEFETKYVVGCQNGTAEKRFKAYLNPKFREIEMEGLKHIFTQLTQIVKNNTNVSN
jgi:hypothetical protein